MPGFDGRGEQDFHFAAGSVRGVRLWSLNRPDFCAAPLTSSWFPERLTGATGFTWWTGAQEASCNSDKSHKPPVEIDPSDGKPCGCGFWAYWDFSGSPMSVGSGDRLPVAGVIEGTGRVLIGERGFRSQKARIIALAPAFRVQPEIPQIRLVPRADVQSGEGLADEDALLREGQRQADAWMAVIQDRLQVLYPEAKVFATARGMLASVRTGEVTGP